MLDARFSQLYFLQRGLPLNEKEKMKAVIVQMVKMMNCHTWYVKVKETVSDEAGKDQWEFVPYTEKSD